MAPVPPFAQTARSNVAMDAAVSAVMARPLERGG